MHGDKKSWDRIAAALKALPLFAGKRTSALTFKKAFSREMAEAKTRDARARAASGVCEEKEDWHELADRMLIEYESENRSRNQVVRATDMRRCIYPHIRQRTNVCACACVCVCTIVNKLRQVSTEGLCPALHPSTIDHHRTGERPDRAAMEGLRVDLIITMQREHPQLDMREVARLATDYSYKDHAARPRTREQALAFTESLMASGAIGAGADSAPASAGATGPASGSGSCAGAGAAATTFSSPSDNALISAMHISELEASAARLRKLITSSTEDNEPESSILHYRRKLAAQEAKIRELQADAQRASDPRSADNVATAKSTPRLQSPRPSKKARKSQQLQAQQATPSRRGKGGGSTRGLVSDLAG